VFPFRTDRKWFNKTRRQKKYVRIRFRGKTLIRLSTIKFTKHYNPTSTLDLVRGVRNQVLAVYVSHWVVCCFGSLQRSKRGEWLLDKSLNSFLRYVTFENQRLYNAMKFLRRLLPGLQRKCRNNSCNAWFAFPNKFLQWEKSPTDLKSLEELVTLLDATYIFFCVFDTSALAVDAVTQLRCVIFLDKFSLSIVRQKKTKSRLAYFSLPHFFLSPPTFWEARDQPEPGSFFPRMYRIMYLTYSHLFLFISILKWIFGCRRSFESIALAPIWFNSVAYVSLVSFFSSLLRGVSLITLDVLQVWGL